MVCVCNENNLSDCRRHTIFQTGIFLKGCSSHATLMLLWVLKIWEVLFWLIYIFSYNTAEHYICFSPKEIALNWLLVKPLLFVVETWAYFSTSSCLRRELMNNTFILKTLLLLQALHQDLSSSIPHYDCLAFSLGASLFLVTWTSFFLNVFLTRAELFFSKNISLTNTLKKKMMWWNTWKMLFLCCPGDNLF